jgi:hypothetical protein
VPWRGGQRSVSSVRLTVSPENCPVILGARANLDRLKPALVVPEKLPSGCSTRSRIRTIARLNQTTPDKRPCLLVSLTAQSPQRETGTARPWTLQIPSASCGAATVGSTARTGKTPANEAHTAMTKKCNNPGNTVRPLRSITRPPELKSPPRLEDAADDPLGIRRALINSTSFSPLQRGSRRRDRPASAPRPAPNR